jgi:DNA-binding GntR family transcriptional regulator
MALRIGAPRELAVGESRIAITRHGVSRIRVREALRRLESEGLVVLVPNSGAWVAKLDQAECVEPLALAESSTKRSENTLSRIHDISAGSCGRILASGLTALGNVSTVTSSINPIMRYVIP